MYVQIDVDLCRMLYVKMCTYVGWMYLCMVELKAILNSAILSVVNVWISLFQ